tara:strand:- start:816 stop:1256 length:441 start_codon:yes stop_codon:yes gene_type:complete
MGMIYKRRSHSKIIFVSFCMPVGITFLIFYAIILFLATYLLLSEKINVYIFALLSVSPIIFSLVFSLLNQPDTSNCDEYVVESSALSYARANYGAGASATGCTFNAGTVRKSGDTYSVTVFCGGNNPIDFTYECSNSGLQLVSVEL